MRCDVMRGVGIDGMAWLTLRSLRLQDGSGVYIKDH